jgi:hypothetical protein
MLQSKKYMIQVIENWAQEHKDIERFIFEFENQKDILITEDSSFPVMFVAPTENTYSNITTYGFRIWVYDIIQKDRSNTIDNVNRTELICQDFVRYFNEDNPNVDFWLEPGVTSVPTNDALIDYCQGHYIDVFIQANPYSDCDIPLR